MAPLSSMSTFSHFQAGVNTPNSEARPAEPRAEYAPTLCLVGTWEWDFGSGNVTWSDGLYRLLGLEPGSVRPSYDLFLSQLHPEDRSAGEAMASAAMTSGLTIGTEFRVIRTDGSMRWLSKKGEVFKDAAGKPSWAAGALFDITEIREAQQDLAAREERYRALATMNSLGEWRAGPKGEVVEAEYWSAFTGQSAEELQGSGWLQAVHPDDVDSLRAVWDEARQIGCKIQFSFRVRHHSGEYRWILAKAAPIKNPDGSVREWVGSDEDIHVNREAEEKLRISEKRLRLALEDGRMVMWDYDFHSGYVTRSDKSLQLLGTSSGPIDDLSKWIYPEDLVRVLSAIRRTQEAGEPYDIEYRIIDHSGRTKWVHARGRLLRNAHAAPDRMLGVTFDISAQKEAEAEGQKRREELHACACRIQALERVVRGFIWTAGPDGRVTDIRGWRDLTGQTCDEIKGLGWLNAVHPADRERTRTAMQRLIDTNSPVSVQYRIRSRAGDYGWVESRATPIVRHDGNVIEWVGVIEPSDDRGADAANQTSSEWAAHGSGDGLISGCEIRAARAILRWAVHDLAQASRVSASTIRRIEEEDSVPQSRNAEKLLVLRATLETAGVEFWVTPDGRRGVAQAKGQ